MATNNRTNTSATKAENKLTPAHLKVIREILSEVSSASEKADREDELRVEERFALESTQINVDFAQAMLCEVEEDISLDIPRDGFFDLLRSTEYEKLRRRFIEDATRPGNTYAFQAAIWRAYSAGRCSPDRIVPRLRQEREESRG